MDNAPMNQILEASGLSERELRQLDAGAAKPVRKGSFAWRSYLRCLFLLAIMAAVGYLAWRPAMFRFSLLMTTVAPSRGDSLAWKPDDDDATPRAPARRLSAPAEWRLEARHGIGWKMQRPYSDGVSNWHGDTFPLAGWQRSSDNPWNWQDDFDTWRKHEPEADVSEIPTQRAASEYRAKDAENWGSIQIAAADRPETSRAAVTPPEEPVREPPAPRVVPNVLPLPQTEMAALPESGASANRIAGEERREMGDGREVSDAREMNETPERLETPGQMAETDSLTALRLPSQTVQAGRIAVPVQEVPAPEAVTLPQTLPSRAPYTDFQPANQAAFSEAAEAPYASVPSAVAETAPELAQSGPGTAPGPLTAVATGGVGEETVADWKNREISGPIPGSYLTIYPKLKFIGLCVPTQGYIRKYNQVTVPADLLSPKFHARDGRTPYGKYFIAGRERTGQGARLLLSWPSPDDARRIGLDAGTVSTIENAWLDQIMPPQNTPAGGGVMLSAIRPGQEHSENGFALEEPNMEEIFTALPDGAWVFVQP